MRDIRRITNTHRISYFMQSEWRHRHKRVRKPNDEWHQSFAKRHFERKSSKFKPKIEDTEDASNVANLGDNESFETSGEQGEISSRVRKASTGKYDKPVQIDFQRRNSQLLNELQEFNKHEDDSDDKKSRKLKILKNSELRPSQSGPKQTKKVRFNLDSGSNEFKCHFKVRKLTDNMSFSDELDEISTKPYKFKFNSNEETSPKAPRSRKHLV